MSKQEKFKGRELLKGSRCFPLWQLLLVTKRLSDIAKKADRIFPDQSKCVKKLHFNIQLQLWAQKLHNFFVLNLIFFRCYDINETIECHL